MGIHQLWRGYTRYKYEGPVIDELSHSVLKEHWSSNINVKDGHDVLGNIAHQFKLRQHIRKDVVLGLPGILTKLEMF